MDDCFGCIKFSTENILNSLNSFHPAIKFTIERENNNKLPFLDVLVTKTNQGLLQRQVYRKPTHTGRYLNFQSYHHHSHKIYVIDSLLYRALIISDPEFLEDEIKYVTSNLKSNGYPEKIIKQRLIIMKTRIANRVHNQSQTQNSTPRMILPFMGPLTYRLTAYLRNKLNCDFGYIPGRKIKNMICNHKYTDNSKGCVGVYKIPCSCPSSYIGETSRPLKTRLREHEGDVKNKNPKSAVASHLIQNKNHIINFDSASLIFHETRYFHRIFMESLYIQKSEHTMNRDKGLDINPICSSLMLPLVKIP